MCADETIVPYVHIAFTLVHIIVREDGRAKRHDCVFTDMYASRICFVQCRFKRDNRAFTKLHLPDSNEVLPSYYLYDFTQPFA